MTAPRRSGQPPCRPSETDVHSTARTEPGRYGLTLLAGGLLLTLAFGCVLPAAPRTLSIWVTSADDEVTADTPPSPENDVYSATRGEVRLQAALNETVSLQVGFRTTAPPVGPLEVRLSDLGGPSASLPANAVATIYRVHYVRVDRFRAWYVERTGRTAEPALLPDILVPWDAPRGGGPLTLAEPRNELVWVDVHVPVTATPGEYQGRLEVRRTKDATPVFACVIRLNVLPVALPDRRSLPVICRVDPRDLLAAHLRWPRAAAEETRLLPQVPSHFAAVRLVGEALRLFQAHRTTPVLWASFPKFQPVGERTVEVQWEEYDRLVSPWLDGSAFPDHVRLEAWPIPASLEYPNAERNGGFDSPGYARLLAAYLAECKRHFAERGWLERAFVRICPPEPLSSPAVERVDRLTKLVQPAAAGETGLPVMAHLPAYSLRGLGWQEAPAIELSGVSIWAPPAMWHEPAAMERQRKLGQRTWFMPDYAPYSGSLAVEAPATDARILGWQAYRYGSQGLWIEHAAEFAATTTPASTALEPWAGSGLIHPAEEYGLRDRPVASVRLKRLLLGLQDYELLRLLEDNGKRLLAQKLAEQVVRWAFTDACRDNLVSCKETGWPRQGNVLRLARNLILQELVAQFEPDPAARQRQIENLAQWGRMMSQAQRIAVRVEGVRLAAGAQDLRAQVLVSALNATNRPVQGRWLFPAPPPDWQQVQPVATHLDAGARRPATIDLSLAGLAYNIDGVYPFDLAFETAALGTIQVPARLAVAVCLPLEVSPVVDGRLDDWPLASNNIAGDFRLCREPAAAGDLPTLPTRAFFAMDERDLYVAVRCTLRPGEPPAWRADNTIPIDGSIPWGQDVVEILIDPRTAVTGTSSDLYCLQVKPTGLLVARKGCRTEPPMGTSEAWSCGARGAASVQREDWVVELAVPLSAFGPEAQRNRVWGFNVTRLDARRGEYSSWSGARGYCYAPQFLGNLIMLWP